jgi:hypothetical protein
MTDGAQTITCWIPTDVLLDNFGASDTEAFRLFLGHQSEIEDLASEKFGREGASDGRITLDQIDLRPLNAGSASPYPPMDQCGGASRLPLIRAERTWIRPVR